MTAPSNTVEFQGATYAVVGHSALLEFEPTTCLEALGEIRTQLTRATVQIVRTDRLAEVPIWGERAHDGVEISGA